MLRLEEYCKNVKDDAYGGSIELVEDGLTAMRNEVIANQNRNVTNEIELYVDKILAVTSPILPLINTLNRCMRFAEEYENSTESKEELMEKFIDFLELIRQEQRECTNKIGRIGSRLIGNGDKVGTFSTSGSVMKILENAVEAKKNITAVAFEARPGAEGYRTLDEVSAQGIPVKFGCDALLCKLIPGSNVFFIGADAISSTGEVYAKTGSYLAALACREFGIPFYVAADTSKFDSMSLLGFPIKDSYRPAREVTESKIPENSEVVNISFELIPSRLISGIITEKGVIAPQSVSLLMQPENMSIKMIGKLEDWAENSMKLR